MVRSNQALRWATNGLRPLTRDDQSDVIIQSCLDDPGVADNGCGRRKSNLNVRRIMLVCWIALSVAVAPIASAWASMHVGQGVSGHKVGGHEQSASQPTAAADAAGNTADMADCHKAMKTSGDCPCCDTKAKCPSDAACMTKCCKVIGAALSPARFTLHPMVHGRPAEPDKPPEWVSKPPSPPPRT